MVRYMQISFKQSICSSCNHQGIQIPLPPNDILSNQYSQWQQTQLSSAISVLAKKELLPLCCNMYGQRHFLPILIGSRTLRHLLFFGTAAGTEFGRWKNILSVPLVEQYVTEVTRYFCIQIRTNEALVICYYS